MKRFFLFFIILIISISFVNAAPTLPMIISGKVYINDKTAPVGTEIKATADGKEVVNFKVAKEGQFSFLIQKLGEDELIKFYVDGIDTEVSINYKGSDYQELDLSVEKRDMTQYIVGGLIALLIVLGAILIIWKIKRK